MDYLLPPLPHSPFVLDPSFWLFDDEDDIGDDDDASIDTLVRAMEAEDEEVEEEETLLAFLMGYQTLFEFGSRLPRYHRPGPRFDWDEEMQTRMAWDDFSSAYLMEIPSFEKLVAILSPYLQLDYLQARRAASTAGVMSPRSICALGLRWLAGGRWADVRDLFRVSRASFYRYRYMFMTAVLVAPELAIRWPQTRDELDHLASEFEGRSTHGCFKTCVGTADGLFTRILQPRNVDNPRAYFSGNKEGMGVNVQAVCDVRTRFLFISTCAPGNMPDVSAYELCGLKDLVDGLPMGYHLAGDNAYTLSEKMMVPFCGNARGNVTKDVFNFYLCQLRIRIEMAFGLMKRKFGILRTALETGIERVGLIVEACARLHNFIVTEERVDPDTVAHEINLKSIEEMVEEDIEVEKIMLPSMDGESYLRDAYVERIRQEGWVRPAANLERRAAEQV